MTAMDMTDKEHPTAEKTKIQQIIWHPSPFSSSHGSQENSKGDMTARGDSRAGLTSRNIKELNETAKDI
jgi:hypothetical protein